jgi:hypothetical protein
MEPRPEPRAVPLLRDAIRAYLAGTEYSPFTAVEVAGVVGEDVVRVFDAIKDMMRSGEVKYAPLDLYPAGTKFPFPTTRDRCDRTLFVFDPK